MGGKAMSMETSEWLHNNIVVGFTAKRGNAWWMKAAVDSSGRPNHYDGAVPIERVKELLGFEVAPRTVWVDGGTEHGIIEMPERRAWVRMDTGEVMGIHSDGYAGHQYGEWLVRNVENLLDSEVQVGGAGLLAKGAQAYVQVEIPETIEVQGVAFRPTILATTSFDGSIATTYKETVQIVVCDNTRAMALRGGGRVFRVKHTRNSQMRISEARQALGLLHQIGEEFAAEVEQLLSIEVSDRQWSKFLEAYAPIENNATQRSITMAENKRGELNRMYRHDVRVQPWAGSAYGVVQAVNTFVHHAQKVQRVSRVERNLSRAIEGKVEALDKGTLATLNQVLQLPQLVAA